MKSKAKRKLVVEFDVTNLTKDEISALMLEAVVQGEASDGQGGKRYHGETGHPDVPVTGTKVVKRPKKRSTLVIEFDVTGLTKDEIGWLASEATVQGEASDDHPDVKATTKVVMRGGKS